MELAIRLATGDVPMERFALVPTPTDDGAIKLLGGLVKLLLDIAIGTGVEPEGNAPDTLVGGLEADVSELDRVRGLFVDPA